MASSFEILPVSENNASALLTERPHAHEVQFYETDGFLIRSVANFVGASLKAGGSAILLATEAHRGPILEQLDRNGVPSHAMLNRCVALDAREILSKFMVEGYPDREKFFTVIGELLREAASSARIAAAPVSAFGEMVAVLWAEGKREAAVQLEQLWNDLGHAQCDTRP